MPVPNYGIGVLFESAEVRNLVAMDRCNECGYEYDLSQATSAGQAIVVGADRLGALLEDNRNEVRRRRAAKTWSPLEYGCHLRDVLLVQRERVLLARRAERPSVVPMGRDERVDHDGYDKQDPADVARQLSDAARMFENVLARLGPSNWERTVIYNYPARSERSLEWIAAHTLHEVRHHLLDVERQLS